MLLIKLTHTNVHGMLLQGLEENQIEGPIWTKPFRQINRKDGDESLGQNKNVFSVLLLKNRRSSVFFFKKQP